MIAAHLPTLLLVIGLPVYWMELWVFKHPTGNTTWAAAVIAACAALYVMRCDARQGVPRPAWPGWFFGTGIAAVAVISAAAFYAALFPPHLPQEFDAINYHITLPRQHLMAGSFVHLPWSTADLYCSPLDYALAPYWLATALPNKFPQVLFFAGFLMVAARLARVFAPGQLHAAGMTVLALAGTHMIGIQAGTAMLDLPACYLFFAALDSLFARRPVLASVELAFFAWSKSFMPVYILTALALTAAVYGVHARFAGGNQWQWAFSRAAEAPRLCRRFLGGLLVSSLVIAGPFVWRSVHYAGTPLYPMACGALDGRLKDSPVCAAAQAVMTIKDSYGTGRGFAAFLRHFWLVAVPEKGVNNRFDYPLGLTFLLVFPPFVVLTGHALRRKEFPLLPVFFLVYWALWWCLGSQQSRFLFVPLAGIIMTSVPALQQHNAAGRIFKGALLIALALTVLSVLRAHKADWGRSAGEVLRPEDREILRMAAGVKPGEIVTLQRFDNAFAPFRFDVRDAGSEFIIRRK